MDEMGKTIDDLVPTEVVPIADLHPHPRNYNEHPDDQLEHLVVSLQEYGQFRNVVIARDGTLLAGHGVVEAATLAGWSHVEVRRLDLDANDPAALKLVALDNEIGRFAGRDDRLLSELLREVQTNVPSGLLGTGYDEQMLANLVMVTRPAHEITDIDHAAEWVGMPSFTAAELPGKYRLMLFFDDQEARDAFIEQVGVLITRGREAKMASAHWPPRGRDDPGSVLIEG